MAACGAGVSPELNPIAMRQSQLESEQVILAHRLKELRLLKWPQFSLGGV